MLSLFRSSNNVSVVTDWYSRNSYIVTKC